MPRTTTVELPGCPPIRALTFDVLGFVKVIEARGKQGGVPKVVERWGEPDPSRCVLAASIDDRHSDPLLAVARKSGSIEVFSPQNGDLRVSITRLSHADVQPEDDAIVGLHMFKKRRLELSSRSCTLLTCTTKGHASMRSVEVPKSPLDSISNDSPTTWNEACLIRVESFDFVGHGEIGCYVKKLQEQGFLGTLRGMSVSLRKMDQRSVCRRLEVELEVKCGIHGQVSLQIDQLLLREGMKACEVNLLNSCCDGSHCFNEGSSHGFGFGQVFVCVNGRVASGRGKTRVECAAWPYKLRGEWVDYRFTCGLG
ncbi:hypothetical protein U1Q18_007125 [Sarracenia purpurea var. burkii]